MKSANLAVRFLLELCALGGSVVALALAGHIVLAAALGAAMAINSALLVALV